MTISYLLNIIIDTVMTTLYNTFKFDRKEVMRIVCKDGSMGRTSPLYTSGDES